MTLRVHTATLAYDGPWRLDVSRYGNCPTGVAFAPSLALLLTAKRRERERRFDRLAQDLYATAYRAELHKRWAVDPAPRDALLARPCVVLCCYCRAGWFCHRVVLARELIKHGARYQGELGPGE